MLAMKNIPFSLLLILLHVLSVSAGNLFSRAVTRAHTSVSRHTKSFARDLRVAFGAVLQTQNGNDIAPKTRVVYCKSGSGTLAGGGDGTSDPGDAPITGGNGTSSTGTKGPSGGKPAGGGGGGGSPWNLKESHSGQNFFDGWDFWTDGDPTKGIVDYVDQNTARSNGLLQINSNGNPVWRVETTPTVQGNRKSIRITTHNSYNGGGLFILDAVHMPVGCGVWPAFWTNGPNWPAGGEIDIVEGVGTYTHNQATIHTNPGCNLPSGDSGALGITGTVVGGTNCAASQTGNQGCGVRADSDISYGTGFNNNGGGVYAMQWDSSGVAVYFFPRGSIPSDISSSSPKPSNWGKPMAKWPSTNCDPFKFFYQQVAIFDTTLCGDWQGGVWGSSGIPGQEQSCAQMTGSSTCEAFVRGNGAAFNEAYWEVKSVKIYQQS